MVLLWIFERRKCGACVEWREPRAYTTRQAGTVGAWRLSLCRCLGAWRLAVVLAQRPRREGERLQRTLGTILKSSTIRHHKRDKTHVKRASTKSSFESYHYQVSGCLYSRNELGKVCFW